MAGGGVVEWWSGGVVEWWSGGVVEWGAVGGGRWAVGGGVVEWWAVECSGTEGSWSETKANGRSAAKSIGGDEAGLFGARFGIRAPLRAPSGQMETGYRADSVAERDPAPE